VKTIFIELCSFYAKKIDEYDFLVHHELNSPKSKS